MTIWVMFVLMIIILLGLSVFFYVRSHKAVGVAPPASQSAEIHY